MKTLTFLCCIFVATASFASPARDALLGTFSGVQPDGRGCQLLLEDVNGKTDLSFDDNYGRRTLWNSGVALEKELARNNGILVFDSPRESFNGATIHLEIRLSPRTGQPVSMNGTVDGLLHAVVSCTGLKR